MRVNPGFTNRARAPVSGWVRTTGWTTGSSAGARPALPLTLTHGVDRGLELRLPVVDRGQRGEESLQGRAQVHEGGHLVGKERVTTGRRDHDRPEDRPERRALHESHVRVPVEPLAARGDVAVVGVDGPGPGVV